jgi:PhzF family phenazine biosynthesis protein
MRLRLPLYQVDAFTDRPFHGNPAAVVPLERWLPDKTLQAIAAENNLSETAFLVPREDGWDLRWFTPRIEVELCGHATLASARIVFDRLAEGSDEARFHTRSGELGVRADGADLVLDFPACPPTPCEAPAGLVDALGGSPREFLTSSLYDLVIYGSEAEVREVVPDERALLAHEKMGVIISAPGDEVDFVSRFFAPRVGILEDPVTGSAHCVSTPYWAKRLGRPRLRARQISERVGDLVCEDRGERVSIAGRAVVYLEGEINVDTSQ